MHQRHAEDVKRIEEKHRSGVKVDQETRNDGRRTPDLVGILLSSSVESEPLCEMASEWTPMPQPLVVDSGAAETVIPRTWFPNHKTVESEGSKRGVFYTTADGCTVENEGEKTLIMSAADGAQLRRVTFHAANVNKALGSVSKMVRNGNRVVFDTSGSYIEKQDDERHAVAPGKRWRVRCGHDGTARKRTEGQTAFWEAEHVAGLVSPNETTEEHGMCHGWRLHAMDDDEKMDEDKEETDNE